MQPFHRQIWLFSHTRPSWRKFPSPVSCASAGQQALTLVLVSLACTISFLWIDHPLAHAVNRILPANKVATNMPDFLGLFVLAISALSLLSFGIALKMHLPRLARSTPLLAVAAPLAFGLKALSKWVFGRIAIRVYLYHPNWDGFHWFRGHGHFDGFPSGHMLVATTLVAIVVSTWPRLRILGTAALASLAAALILTSYHFLADILAGWGLGSTLAWVMLKLDKRIRPGSGDSTGQGAYLWHAQTESQS